MITKVEYEKEPCTRCGGSGTYSYCQMYGNTCFKCSGSGWQLTKRGRAAMAYADTLLNVTISQFMEMDDRVATYTDRFAGKRYNIVKAVETATHATRLEDGKRIPIRCFNLVTPSGKIAVNIAGAESGIRLKPRIEDIHAIHTYQENLTKAGKPRKRPVKSSGVAA